MTSIRKLNGWVRVEATIVGKGYSRNRKAGESE
jgi:hypothetical protein